MYGLQSTTGKRHWIGTFEAVLDYAAQNAMWMDLGAVIVQIRVKQPVGGLF